MDIAIVLRLRDFKEATRRATTFLVEFTPVLFSYQNL